MDFIGQIGERYLTGKANAAPQQLENIVKKHLIGGADEPGVEGGGKGASIDATAATGQEGAKAPGTGSAEKDEEIARLRKQLAQLELEKGTPIAAAKKGSGAGKAAKKTEDLQALGSGAGIKKGLDGKKRFEAPKNMKGLKALGAGAAASADSKGKKQLESTGRRQSGAESRAAIEKSPALDDGAGKFESKQAEGLAALAVLGAGAGASRAGRSEKGHGSEASSVGRRHSVSSTQRDTASVVSSHHTEKPRRSKSVKQPSEYGSEAHGIAPSRKFHKQASGHGSDARSISPPRKSPKKAMEYESELTITSPPRAPPEHKPRRGLNGYAVVEESRSLVPYDPRTSRAESEAEEGELYIIEVEEDLPRRRKSTKERRGGVVEISHSKGRTVYKIK
ncbi:hypothetical protein N7G274_006793 [Stereocaulon virgatum]|uniref:Uncharacterized protein n=1 Tax=Stereocaulon virgatum TaxID=373712 RepID=A0ABR4A5K6_9LECA